MISKIWTNKDQLSNELKTLWEKEKLLVTSNLSFSHNVFKSCLLLMRQNEYLWSKGLTPHQNIMFHLLTFLTSLNLDLNVIGDHAKLQGHRLDCFSRSGVRVCSLWELAENLTTF